MGSSTLRYAGLLLAIALALVAQQLVVQPQLVLAGWIVFAVAALLAAIAAPPQPPMTPPPTPAAPTTLLPLRIILGGAALAAAAGAAWLNITPLQPRDALMLWLASLLLASLALWGTTVAPPLRAATPWSGREALVVAVICAVALIARTMWLDDVPRYYFDDESRVGMYVRNLFNADRFPRLFAMGWNSWPVLGMVLQGIFGLFLGVDTTTLRLSSAVAGTIAVLFTYLLAREMFSPRVALISAVLFACGRTALDFSRMGICHAQVLTFETLAFWSLWRALNRGSGVSYLWTGIGLGLCLHTYNAGQLLPLLWLGWVALSIAWAPRLAIARWRGGMLTAVGLAFTVLPFMLYVTDNFGFAGHWNEYTGMARNRQVMTRVGEAWSTRGPVEGLRILGEQARLTWLGFNVLPADAYQLGYRGGGMLDHISAPLFVLGLAICLARFWTPRYAFILYWWLVTMVMGGVITQAPPAYVRMVGILPALALFGALPLDAILRSAGAALLRSITLAVAALLGIAMAWDNYRTYFIIFPRTTSQPSSELTRYLYTTPPNARVLLAGAEHFLEISTEIYRLNLGERVFANVGELSHLLPLRERPDRPLVLLFGETQLTLVPYAQSLYPDIPVTEVSERGHPEHVLFRAMVIPAERIAARQGLTVSRDGTEPSPSRLPSKDGVSAAAVGDPFATRSPISGCTELQWTGGIYWPTDRVVTVQVDAPSTTSVTIGAAPLARNGTSVQFARGWNRIRILEQCSDTRQFALRFTLDGRTTPFTRSDLRPDYVSEGLLATYLRGENPVLRTIDSHMNAFAIEELLLVPYDVPVRMPFTITWTGTLEVDVPGDYQFEARFSGPTLITLDGSPLIQETVKIPEEPRTAKALRSLEKGSHPLFALWDSTRASHTSRRIFQLFWQPPGGTLELIPPSHLLPAVANEGGPLPTIAIPPTPTPIALRSGPRQELTQLTAHNVKFGFAEPRIDKSWNGAAITMRGIEYTRGIGLHAWAELTYPVPPNATELQAIVGLADDTRDCPRATVRFEIHNDAGGVLYDSGKIDTFTPPKLATAAVAGLKTVTLKVTDAGDGIDCDHANWAEPSFLLR